MQKDKKKKEEVKKKEGVCVYFTTNMVTLKVVQENLSGSFIFLFGSFVGEWDCSVDCLVSLVFVKICVH